MKPFAFSLRSAAHGRKGGAQGHRGRIVKTTGNGLLIEFASIVDAVRCAVKVRRELAERNTDVPPDRRIEFRMGINLRDIIKDGCDIDGDGVNLAARLEASAGPGGICVGRVVRDKFDFSFEDMGEQQVKNIARPIRVSQRRSITRQPRPRPVKENRDQQGSMNSTEAAWCPPRGVDDCDDQSGRGLAPSPRTPISASVWRWLAVVS